MSSLNADMSHLDRSRGALRTWLDENGFKGRVPFLTVTLGSCLGGIVDQFAHAPSVPHGRLEWPTPRVKGHAGMVHAVQLGGELVLLVAGRAHYYGTQNIQQTVTAARVMTLLGCKRHLFTCASGGIRDDLGPGDLVIITDHLNEMGVNPLSGYNVDALGKRFPDMSVAYCPEIRAALHSAARDLDHPIAEGVYAAVPGPSYETPAEIRKLERVGADMVGMSTVPEMIAVRHMGARAAALSMVTNKAAGKVKGATLDHDEVGETAAEHNERFQDVVLATVRKLCHGK